MTSERHTAAALCAELAEGRRRLGAAQALARLTQGLESQPPSVWVECARQVAAASDEPASLRWLHEASLRWPDEFELRYCLATALWNHGETTAAEQALRQLLTAMPAHAAGNELLAKVLRNEGQLGAAAQVVYAQTLHQSGGVHEVLRAVDFIRHCQRHALAARLCDDALAEGLRDASLYAQAGLLALELGRFDAARAHLLESIERGVDLNTWFVFGALAFAQKYTRADHADFQLFTRHLRAPGLSALARASLTFALAKAHDDVGDTARASALWRKGNAQARALRPWSAARYGEQIDALLRASSGCALAAAPIVPIFVVGLPRSGTTLAAVCLSRLPGVRDRGELPHIDFIAQQLGAQRADADALREAAQLYYRHLRQDDAPARYYIDKTPTNFLRLDLIANLFPQAHVVHCRRNRRDTALSLYAQHFAHADGDFSYDFADIAAFAAGHDRLMEHWHRTLSLPIHTLDYEHVVGDAQATMAQLREDIGIAASGDFAVSDSVDGVIGSSSLWQAKQPVYTSSLGRWRRYAEHLPELEAMFPDRTL